MVLINLLLLGFVFFQNKPQLGIPFHLRMAAKHEMNLDDKQLEKFVESAERHKKAIRDLNEQQQALLQQYYLPLLHDKKNVNSASLEKAINQIEKRKLEITYQHFEEVKTMLRPEQMAGYQHFIQNALGRILGHQKKGDK